MRSLQVALSLRSRGSRLARSDFFTVRGASVPPGTIGLIRAFGASGNLNGSPTNSGPCRLGHRATKMQLGTIASYLLGGHLPTLALKIILSGPTGSGEIISKATFVNADAHLGTNSGCLGSFPKTQHNTFPPEKSEGKSAKRLNEGKVTC